MFDAYSDIFEQRGAQYTTAMRLSPLARANEFNQALLMSNLSNGHRVLDMPAGGAYLRDFIDDETIDYVAVESTAGFVSRLPVGDRPSLVMTNDLGSVQLPSNSIDRVISIAGLHHIEDRAPVYAEVRRLLRMNGAACFADVQVGTSTAKFLNDTVDKYCSLGHKGLFLNEADVSLLEAASLSVCNDKLVDVPWCFSSIQEMTSFCKLLFGLDNALDDESITEAIIAELGVVSRGTRVLMNWQLRFICVVAV